MLSDIINTCIIFTFKDEDYEAFCGIYPYNAVKVIKGDISPKDEEKPMMIVGWDNVKSNFPNQLYLENKIKSNLYWCPSLSEDKDRALSDSKNFINDVNEIFLKKECITYDFMLNGDFSEFINNFINKNEKVYIYFYTTACYVFNNNNIFCINLESLKVNGIDFKKVLTNLFNELDVVFLSYENMCLYVFPEELKLVNTFENLYWTIFAVELYESDFNSLFPETSDIRRFMPFLMSFVSTFDSILNDKEKMSALKYFKKDIITGWLSKQEIFFDKSFESDKVELLQHNGLRYKRLKYSNKRTITGRINCIDRQLNPQNLPKDSDIRKHIVSRYKGGKIVVIDYISFETKISMFLSGHEDFIKENQYKDLHIETAKVIFCKDSVSEEERNIGKHINHTLIYGGGREKLKSILKDISNNEEVLKNVYTFLSPIINAVIFINTMYNDNGGYVINRFGTIVRPHKVWAAFNNYISSTATDIVIEKLFEIKEFIKNRRIHFLFQVHDSFVFDMHTDEVEHINDFTNFISHFNNETFQVECKIADNLFSCV
jgi:hypothetical protein